MRRVLALLIVAALAGGVVALGVHDDGERVEHWLPAVLPIGLRLTQASVAAPGATLAAPLEVHRLALYRGRDAVFVGYVDRPDPEVPANEPFLDGVAFVSDGPHDVLLRWSTSTSSGFVESTGVRAADVRRVARQLVRRHFQPPAGWTGTVGFDRASAIESLQYGDAVTVLVHRRRDLAPVPIDDVAQRRVGDVVVSVRAPSLPAADLRAVLDSVADVSSKAWQEAMDRAGLDGRPWRWRALAHGLTSFGDAWAFAVADRGDESCPALVSARYVEDREPRCVVVWWRSDPVLAVPTDRRGPVTVTAAGRTLRQLGEARWRGRRIVIAEVPSSLVAGIIDPVEVVSRR